MKEFYQTIFDFDNYQISNLGNVKNIITGKILKPLKSKTGHCRVYLYNESGRKRFLVHRLVAIHFIPNPDNYYIINHLNCDPTDNRIQNLEWTTYKGNTIHAKNNNRLIPPVGSKNGMSVLKDSDVLKIIKYWNNGLTQKQISDKMGVTRSCVAHITQGNRWKQYSHLIERK